MNTPKIVGMDASAALRELAQPWAGGEKVKIAINRAARQAGLSYWRAFDIWYGKARRVEQSEIEAINEALAKKRREDARNELQQIWTRLIQLEARMAQTDPDFDRELFVPLRQAVRSTQ